MSNQQVLKEVIEDRYDRAFTKYVVAPDGSIVNRRTRKLVKGSINRKGYRYISVYNPNTYSSEKCYVHRLVALRYIPNPDNKPHINHKDGDPLNNNRDNLEWCTAQENVVDGFARGREVWNKGNISKERILFYAKKYPRQLLWFLTKDDFAFAKALWGEEGYITDVTGTRFYQGKLEGVLPLWAVHLQQMVIAEDRIEYLRVQVLGGSDE